MSMSLLRHARLTRVTSTALLKGRFLRPHSAHAPRAYTEEEQSSGSFSDHGSVDTTSGAGEVSIEAASETREVTRGRRRRRRKVLESTERNPIEKEAESIKWNPLEANGVELYLNSLKTAGLQPTLEDLERCRPYRRYKPDSLQYELQFEELVHRISRAFSKQQLRAFCEMYELDARSHLSKRVLVLAVIEQAWKWPSLDEIRRRKLAETTTEQISYAVTPSQLFLILGKDGIQLLRISMRYNVHISLKSNPLQLEIEGIKASVEKVVAHLKKFTETIVEDSLQLPNNVPIRADLVPRLSRLAGAFIQNVGGSGKVRICATNPAQLVTTRRLVIRSACEVAESSKDHLIAHVPPDVPNSTPIPLSLFPDNYAVYPFLSPRSLPWTMNTSGSFRIRRVGEWLGTSAGEDIQKTGGLAEGKGRIITIDGKQEDIKTLLLGKLPEPQARFQTTVTASLGHALLTSPSAGQRASIVPPIAGCRTISKILEWLQHADVNTAFLPSMPFPLLHAPPHEQRMFLRLIYRSLNPSLVTGITDTIKLDIELPRLDSDSNAAAGVSDETSAGPTASIRASSDSQTTADNIDKSAQHTSTGKLPLLDMCCWQGQETSVNVLLPDRPMDVRFTAFRFRELPTDQLPPALRQFQVDMRDFLACEHSDVPPPLAPLDLLVNDQSYVLNGSISIRQSLESVSGESDTMTPGASTQVISESIMDVESRHRMLRCQVLCHDLQSPDTWKEFLQNCDRLSSVNYRPVVGFTREGPQDFSIKE